MCLSVRNLFNDKDIILGREEILEVVRHALKNRIVEISFDDTYRNYDYGIDGHTLVDTDYTVELAREEEQ